MLSLITTRECRSGFPQCRHTLSNDCECRSTPRHMMRIIFYTCRGRWKCLRACCKTCTRRGWWERRAGLRRRRRWGCCIDRTGDRNLCYTRNNMVNSSTDTPWHTRVVICLCNTTIWAGVYIARTCICAYILCILCRITRKYNKYTTTHHPVTRLRREQRW